VFATAWADFVIELFTNHLFQAALGEGQDFVDFVLHFRFPFSFLTSYIDIIQTRLEAVNKKKRFFCDFFGTPFARANTMPKLFRHAVCSGSIPPNGGCGPAATPTMGG